MGNTVLGLALLYSSLDRFFLSQDVLLSHSRVQYGHGISFINFLVCIKVLLQIDMMDWMPFVNCHALCVLSMFPSMDFIKINNLERSMNFTHSILDLLSGNKCTHADEAKLYSAIPHV
jgi:hypothetical protein